MKKENKISRLIIYFTILFSSYIVNFTPLTAQNNDEYSSNLPDMILPSPTAQIFQKFMGYKPDLATGTVNVDIPIYTLNENNFSLPFSLKYHTSGIKVHDISYPVGYGWAFMPGLRISRIIMGRADDKARTREIKGDDVLKNTEEEAFEYLRSIMTNNDPSTFIDSQYDIFTLHLPNINVPFLIEKINGTWNARIVDSPLKIEIITTPSSSFSGEEITGFNVTDEKGYIYEFGGNYNLCEHKVTELDGDVATSWVLKRIILPGNNIITFAWTRKEIRPIVALNPTGSFQIRDDINYSLLNDCSDEFKGCRITQVHPTKYNTTEAVLFLKEIITPHQNINLEYDTDVNGNFQVYLKKISVKNKLFELVNECLFEYGKNNEAPLLKKLLIKGQTPYIFNYHPKYFNHTAFNQQDYWGYYNERNNVLLIPRMQINNRSYQYGNCLNNDITGYCVNDCKDLVGPIIGAADRSINGDAMQAFILKEIQYPTGGYTKFEYEPHEFYGTTPSEVIKNNPVLEKGGGLRVKSVKTRADEVSPEIIRIYKYGKNENRKGHATAIPSLETFISERYYYSEGDCVYCTDLSCPGGFNNCDEYSYRITTIGRYSSYMSFLQFNTPIWYDTVTEYTDKEKTIYTNEYTPDEVFELNQSHVLYRGGTTQNFPSKIINAYKNLYDQSPIQNQVKHFMWDEIANNYKLAEANYYNYTEPCFSDQLESLFVDRFVIRTGKSGYPFLDFRIQDGPCNLISIKNYFFKTYRIPQCKKKLAQHIKVTYQGTDSVVQMIEHDYVKHDNRILNLRSTITSTADRDIVKEELLYPYDNLSELNSEQKQYVPDMISKNLISSPVRYKQWKKEYVSSTNFTLSNQKTIQYKLFSNNLVLPEKVYFKTSNKPEELRIQYHNYDAYGNPISISKDNNTNLVYIWGYRGLYPIAEINNVTYQQVSDALGTSVPESFSSSYNPDMMKINSLRNHETLKESFLTTYKYKPMVGMIQSTDPSGISTNYEYDQHGRLIYIRDDDLNYLEAYKYNYKDPYPPLTLMFSGNNASQYEFEVETNNVEFSVTTRGGSGEYSYRWYLEDADNNRIITFNNATSSIKIDFPQIGYYYLTCEVADLNTQKTIQVKKDIYVKVILGFTDIVHSKQIAQNWEDDNRYRVDANLYTKQQVTVQFAIHSNSVQYVDLYINNRHQQINVVSGYRLLDVTLPVGRNSINFSFGYRSSAEVKLELVETMDPDFGYGDVTTIVANTNNDIYR